MTLTTTQKLDNLIDANLNNLVPMTIQFKGIYEKDINNIGNRRVYFALVHKMAETFPVKRPAFVQCPAEAELDDQHAFWINDELTIWEDRFTALMGKVGFHQARVVVHAMQKHGNDLI